ncbi:hypothetical protein DQ04_04151090 [Trypanosoma grayi]|uniref:hypothetical protein n=1 Tax=Trypanosoma grayi TaxID=71804 RepID=UPI0004F49210|nr:hypothetical protein DQ04_04151090 [Trypanosoma grayi]KEG10118.1 hypothetical protein DQ04_04151090 [Trypanosoma grayi]
MTEASLDACASDLFDLVELNGAEAVPAATCVEMLRRVNASLSHDVAVALVNDAKSPGRRDLDRDAFTAALLRVLRSMPYQNSLRVLRDVTRSLRLAFRKRYLMMDVKANTPIPSLTENPTVVSLFQELFVVAAKGGAYITRSQLRQLVHDILPGDRGSASNVVKAAMSEDDSDLIGFYEFVTVMQPITSRLSLSDLVEQFRCRRAASGEWRPSSSDAAPSSLRGAESAAPSAPTPPPGPLGAELQMYRQWDAEAQRRFAGVSMQGCIGAASGLPSPPSFLTSGAAVRGEGVCGGKSKTVLEQEVVRLQRENEALRHDLLRAQTRRPSVRIEDGGRVMELSGDEFFNEENTILRSELAATKERLRMCQATIDLQEDMTAIGAILRTGCTSREALLNVYPDESALLHRYHHLVQRAERQRDAVGPPGSPARLLLAQLDVVVQGYQALYRQLREAMDADGSAAPVPARQGSLRRRRAPWVD